MMARESSMIGSSRNQGRNTMNWKSNRDGWVATNVYFVYIVFPSIGELKKKNFILSFSFSFLLFFAHFCSFFYDFVLLCLLSFSLCAGSAIYIYTRLYI